MSAPRVSDRLLEEIIYELEKTFLREGPTTKRVVNQIMLAKDLRDARADKLEMSRHLRSYQVDLNLALDDLDEIEAAVRHLFAAEDLDAPPEVADIAMGMAREHLHSLFPKKQP